MTVRDLEEIFRQFPAAASVDVRDGDIVVNAQPIAGPARQGKETWTPIGKSR